MIDSGFREEGVGLRCKKEELIRFYDWLGIWWGFWFGYFRVWFLKEFLLFVIENGFYGLSYCWVILINK